MEYICQHCNADLDNGDVFKHFFLQYKNYAKALESASSYGWSETNKVHFDRSVILQCKNGTQYTICPDCKEKNPFRK